MAQIKNLLNISWQQNIVFFAILAGLVACSPKPESASQASRVPDTDPRFSTLEYPFSDGSVLEAGGSDYVLFDATAYINNPNETTWYQKDSLKPVVGSYDLNPTLVRTQLQAMCDAGQRKIGMVLWYMPISLADISTGVYGHVVSSSGGQLTPRHQKNLRDLLGVMSSLKKGGSTALCFNELQFRYAPQGGAEPGTWESWNENKYQENWNFIVNTRAIVEATLADTQMHRLYDLGGEAGGITTGQTRSYVKRLWKDYYTTFGINDSYGFSVALYPGRIAELIRTYDEAGARPRSYGLDVYGNITSYMQAAANELEQKGEKGKAIVIQETYYNDKSVADELAAVRASRGLKIRTIMQWPLAKGSSIQHFSMNSTPSYNNYLSLADVVVPPAAPVAKTASVIGSTGFTANWSVVAGATGYYLDLSTSNTFGTFVSGYNNLSVGNSVSRAIAGLTPGMVYYYRVRAKKYTEVSENSNVIGTITVAALVYTANNFVLRPNQFVDTVALRLIYQTDGNLVIYSRVFNSSALWSIRIADFSKCALNKCFVHFQGDGNLVAYDDNGVPYWASNTEGNSSNKLILIDSAPYLRIEDAAGVIKWESR